MKCSYCGGSVQGWGKVLRHGYLEDGTKLLFRISVVKCKSCKKKHRILPSFLLPYKRFLTEVIARTILAGCPSDSCAAEYATQRQWLQWHEYKEQEFELTLRQYTPLDELCGFASLLSKMKESYPVQQSLEGFEPEPDENPILRHWEATDWLSKILPIYVLFTRGKCPPSYGYLSSA